MKKSELRQIVKEEVMNVLGIPIDIMTGTGLRTFAFTIKDVIEQTNKRCKIRIKSKKRYKTIANFKTIK